MVRALLVAGLLAASAAGSFAASVLSNDTKVRLVFDPALSAGVDSSSSFSVISVGTIDHDIYVGFNSVDLAPDSMTLTGDGTSTEVTDPSQAGTTVPEPETYALMLAGVGVAGFIAMRRKSG